MQSECGRARLKPLPHLVGEEGGEGGKPPHFFRPAAVCNDPELGWVFQRNQGHRFLHR